MRYNWNETNDTKAYGRCHENLERKTQEECEQALFFWVRCTYCGGVVLVYQSWP